MISLLFNIYKKYQLTELYKIQCYLLATWRFSWFQRNYKKMRDIDYYEARKLISEIKARGSYTEQIAYNFCDNYADLDDHIFFDDNRKLYYGRGVETDNRMLFFPKKLDINEIRKLYKSLCYEQDVDSPHRYLSDSVQIEPKDTVIDVGSADGNFILSIIENIKEAYLFECDDNWIEALQSTFEPWKDKIHIINKYVCDYDDENHISLDSFINDTLSDDSDIIVKMDIEGAEMDALKGLNESLNNKKIKAALICAYHNQEDERNIRNYVVKTGYFIQPSVGYITKFAELFSKKPYIRRGVLRIIREQ